MKAAVYRRFGPPEVVRVEEIARPAPGPGDVLIQVHASTVSAADYRARSRDVPPGLGLLASIALGFFRPKNRVLGMDVAGVVEAVGANVTAFKPGDEVIAMLGARFGGHAEYALLPHDGAIALKPRNMTFEEAVTLVFGGITVRGFLNQVTLASGGTVLINGASGAVGTAAVQVAKHLGAHVTAVCSGAARELVVSLGADRVIDYTLVDFAAGPDTYDVIVDCVGNVPFERLEKATRAGGAVLHIIGDLKKILLASSRSRKSGKRVIADVGPYKAQDLAFLSGLAESGHYRAVIDRTYALSDITEAHRRVDAGHKRGNIVLRIAS